MYKLNTKKQYIWDKITLYYDNEPEYGNMGWFLSFDVYMGYKNKPLPLEDLPKEMQKLIIDNVVEKMNN